MLYILLSKPHLINIKNGASNSVSQEWSEKLTSRYKFMYIKAISGLAIKGVYMDYAILDLLAKQCK
jgi:hypothetical protein